MSGEEKPSTPKKVVIQGSVAGSPELFVSLPDEGDPAVHRAAFQARGELRLAVGPRLVLGVEGLYAHTHLTRPALSGTPPLPAHGQSPQPSAASLLQLQKRPG